MGSTRDVFRALVGTSIVLLSLGAGAAVSQERSGAPTRQREGWWEKEKVQTELGLSGQQVSAISEIEEENREATRQLRKVQQKAYRNMVRILTAGSPSEKEIAGSREALEDAWAESIRQSVEHWIKLRDELSSDQWQKLPQVAPRALQLGGFRTRAMGTVKIGQEGD